MLTLDHVRKSYGAHVALDVDHLHLPAGSTTALIGPSGCGKSTLLRLLTGLVRPERGQVQVGGRGVSEDNLLEMRRRIGYVIQDGGLFPHLRVHRNVTLMADYLRWSAERSRERLAELAALVHLPEAMLTRYPAQLSGGQRQRVSLMRALMLDPEVLLLDEPLGALDPIIRFQLQKELRGIFQRLGKTVVVVTHDLAEAVMLAQQLVLLRDGRIVQQGTWTELEQHPREPFVSEFIYAHRAPFEALQGARL